MKCTWWDIVELDGENTEIDHCENDAMWWSCNVNGPVCDKHNCRCNKKLSEKILNKWHNFYLKMAKEFSTMSSDPRLKVGAVIVTEDNILYPGYNGDEIGGNNEPDSLEPGKSGFVHAEANAIAKFNPTIHKNSIMYLTHNPCSVCARLIINTRAIKAVYFAAEYRDNAGVDILRKRGIICEKVEIF